MFRNGKFLKFSLHLSSGTSQKIPEVLKTSVTNRIVFDPEDGGSSILRNITQATRHPTLQYNNLLDTSSVSLLLYESGVTNRSNAKSPWKHFCEMSCHLVSLKCYLSNRLQQLPTRPTFPCKFWGRYLQARLFVVSGTAPGPLTRLIVPYQSTSCRTTSNGTYTKTRPASIDDFKRWIQLPIQGIAEEMVKYFMTSFSWRQHECTDRHVGHIQTVTIITNSQRRGMHLPALKTHFSLYLNI